MINLSKLDPASPENLAQLSLEELLKVQEDWNKTLNESGFPQFLLSACVNLGVFFTEEAGYSRYGNALIVRVRPELVLIATFNNQGFSNKIKNYVFRRTVHVLYGDPALNVWDRRSLLRVVFFNDDLDPSQTHFVPGKWVTTLVGLLEHRLDQTKQDKEAQAKAEYRNALLETLHAGKDI